MYRFGIGQATSATVTPVVTPTTGQVQGPWANTGADILNWPATIVTSLNPSFNATGFNVGGVLIVDAIGWGLALWLAFRLLKGR